MNGTSRGTEAVICCVGVMSRVSCCWTWLAGLVGWSRVKARIRFGGGGGELPASLLNGGYLLANSNPAIIQRYLCVG